MILFEVIVWELFIDFGHDWPHSVIVELLLASQDPKKVKAKSSAGVDNAVRVVVCVHHCVVGFVRWTWSLATKRDDEGGITCIRWNSTSCDLTPSKQSTPGCVMYNNSAILLKPVLSHDAIREQLKGNVFVADDFIPLAWVALQVKVLHRFVSLREAFCFFCRRRFLCLFGGGAKIFFHHISSFSVKIFLKYYKFLPGS